jgi:hypothetical protein
MKQQPCFMIFLLADPDGDIYEGDFVAGRYAQSQSRRRTKVSSAHRLLLFIPTLEMHACTVLLDISMFFALANSYKTQAIRPLHHLKGGQLVESIFTS